MDYFEVFPKTTINNVEVVDISRALSILNDLTPFLMEYIVKDGYSANDVAYELYGQDILYWLIFIVNPGYIFNEVKSTSEFIEYMNDEFNVTALQFSHSLNLLPPINSPVTLKVFRTSDSDNTNEIQIRKIDVYRRQVVLNELIDEPVKVYYSYNEKLIRVEDYDLIAIYLDIEYLVNQGEYVAYDEGGIPLFYFSKDIYKDLTRHFTYNNIAYDRYPDGIDEMLVTSYSWESYELAANEVKRKIKVIRPEYKNDAISIITAFSESLILNV